MGGRTSGSAGNSQVPGIKAEASATYEGEGPQVTTTTASDTVIDPNERELLAMARMLRRGIGTFVLAFARLNVPASRTQLVATVRDVLAPLSGVLAVHWPVPWPRARAAGVAATAPDRLARFPGLPWG